MDALAADTLVGGGSVGLRELLVDFGVGKLDRDCDCPYGAVAGGALEAGLGTTTVVVGEVVDEDVLVVHVFSLGCPGDWEGLAQRIEASSRRAIRHSRTSCSAAEAIQADCPER